MVLRARKAINQEGNNTPSTSNLQENKKSLRYYRKIVKEEFDEHKTKISEMISNTCELQMTV